MRALNSQRQQATTLCTIVSILIVFILDSHGANSRSVVPDDQVIEKSLQPNEQLDIAPKTVDENQGVVELAEHNDAGKSTIDSGNSVKVTGDSKNQGIRRFDSNVEAEIVESNKPVVSEVIAEKPAQDDIVTKIITVNDRAQDIERLIIDDSNQQKRSVQGSHDSIDDENAKINVESIDNGSEAGKLIENVNVKQIPELIPVTVDHVDPYQGIVPELDNSRKSLMIAADEDNENEREEIRNERSHDINEEEKLESPSLSKVEQWKQQALVLQGQLKNNSFVQRLKEQAAEVLPDIPKFTENQLLQALKTISLKKYPSSTESYIDSMNTSMLNENELEIFKCAEGLVAQKQRQSFSENIFECIRGLSILNCMRIFIWPIIVDNVPESISQNFPTLPIEITMSDWLPGSQEKSKNIRATVGVHQQRLITPELVVSNILKDALESNIHDENLPTYIDPSNETLVKLLTEGQIEILKTAEKFLPESAREEYSNSMYSCVRRFEYFSCIKYFAWPMIKQHFPALPEFPDYQSWYPSTISVYPDYPILPFTHFHNENAQLPEVVEAEAIRNRSPRPETLIAHILQNTLDQQSRQPLSSSITPLKEDAKYVTPEQLTAIQMAEQLIPEEHRAEFVEKTMECIKQHGYLPCTKYLTWPAIRQWQPQFPAFPDLGNWLGTYTTSQFPDLSSIIPQPPSLSGLIPSITIGGGASNNQGSISGSISTGGGSGGQGGGQGGGSGQVGGGGQGGGSGQIGGGGQGGNGGQIGGGSQGGSGGGIGGGIHWGGGGQTGGGNQGGGSGGQIGGGGSGGQIGGGGQGGSGGQVGGGGQGGSGGQIGGGSQGGSGGQIGGGSAGGINWGSGGQIGGGGQGGQIGGGSQGGSGGQIGGGSQGGSGGQIGGGSAGGINWGSGGQIGGGSQGGGQGGSGGQIGGGGSGQGGSGGQVGGGGQIGGGGQGGSGGQIGGGGSGGQIGGGGQSSTGGGSGGHPGVIIIIPGSSGSGGTTGGGQVNTGGSGGGNINTGGSTGGGQSGDGGISWSGQGNQGGNAGQSGNTGGTGSGGISWDGQGNQSGNQGGNQGGNTGSTGTGGISWGGQGQGGNQGSNQGSNSGQGGNAGGAIGGGISWGGQGTQGNNQGGNQGGTSGGGISWGGQGNQGGNQGSNQGGTSGGGISWGGQGNQGGSAGSNQPGNAGSGWSGQGNQDAKPGGSQTGSGGSSITIIVPPNSQITTKPHPDNQWSGTGGGQIGAGGGTAVSPSGNQPGSGGTYAPGIQWGGNSQIGTGGSGSGSIGSGGNIAPGNQWGIPGSGQGSTGGGISGSGSSSGGIPSGSIGGQGGATVNPGSSQPGSGGNYAPGNQWGSPGSGQGSANLSPGSSLPGSGGNYAPGNQWGSPGGGQGTIGGGVTGGGIPIGSSGGQSNAPIYPGSNQPGTGGNYAPGNQWGGTGSGQIGIGGSPSTGGQIGGSGYPSSGNQPSSPGFPNTGGQIGGSGYPSSGNQPSSPGYPSTGGQIGGSGYPSSGNQPSSPGYPSTGGQIGGGGYPSSGNQPTSPGYPSTGGQIGGSGYPSSGNQPSSPGLPSTGGQIGGSGYPSSGNQPSSPGFPSTGGQIGGGGYPSSGNQPTSPGYPSTGGQIGGSGYPSSGNQPSSPGLPSTGGQIGGSGYPSSGNQPTSPGYPSTGGQIGGSGYPSSGNQPSSPGFPSTGGQIGGSGYPNSGNQPTSPGLPSTGGQIGGSGYPSSGNQPSSPGLPSTGGQIGGSGYPSAGNQPTSPGLPSTGGQIGGSGYPSSGNQPSSPGLPSTGGQIGGSGYPSSGNQPTSPGLPSTGGQIGGSGYPSSGNQPPSPGLPSTGGQIGSGGSPSTGGQISSPGFPSTGGIPSTGGQIGGSGSPNTGDQSTPGSSIGGYPGSTGGSAPQQPDIGSGQIGTGGAPSGNGMTGPMIPNPSDNQTGGGSPGGQIGGSTSGTPGGQGTIGGSSGPIGSDNNVGGSGGTNTGTSPGMSPGGDGGINTGHPGSISGGDGNVPLCPCTASPPNDSPQSLKQLEPYVTDILSNLHYPSHHSPLRMPYGHDKHTSLWSRLTKEQLTIMGLATNLTPHPGRRDLLSRSLGCMQGGAEFMVCAREVIWPYLSLYFNNIPEFPNDQSKLYSPKRHAASPYQHFIPQGHVPNARLSTQSFVTQPFQVNPAGLVSLFAQPDIQIESRTPSQSSISAKANDEPLISVTGTRFVPIFSDQPTAVILDILNTVSKSTAQPEKEEYSSRIPEFMALLNSTLSEQQERIMKLAENLLPAAIRANMVDDMFTCLRANNDFMSCTRDIIWPKLSEYFPRLPNFPNFQQLRNVDNTSEDLQPLTEDSATISETDVKTGHHGDAMVTITDTRFVPIYNDHPEEVILKLLTNLKISTPGQQTDPSSFIVQSPPFATAFTNQQSKILSVAENLIPGSFRVAFIERMSDCVRANNFLDCTRDVVWPVIGQFFPRLSTYPNFGGLPSISEGIPQQPTLLPPHPESNDFSRIIAPAENQIHQISQSPSYASQFAAASDFSPLAQLQLPQHAQPFRTIQASPVQPHGALFSGITSSVGTPTVVPGFPGQPTEILIDISQERVPEINSIHTVRNRRNAIELIENETKSQNNENTVNSLNQVNEPNAALNLTEPDIMKLLVNVTKSKLDSEIEEPEPILAESLNSSAIEMLTPDQIEILRMVEKIGIQNAKGIVSQVIQCVTGLSFIRCIGIFVLPLLTSALPTFSLPFGRSEYKANIGGLFNQKSMNVVEKELLAEKESVENILIDWYKHLTEEKYSTNYGFLKFEGHGNGEIGVKFTGFRRARGLKIKDNKNLPSILTIISDIMEDVLDTKPEQNKPKKDKKSKSIQFQSDEIPAGSEESRQRSDDEKVIKMFLEKFKPNNTTGYGEDENRYLTVDDAYRAFEVLFGTKMRARFINRLESFYQTSDANGVNEPNEEVKVVPLDSDENKLNHIDQKEEKQKQYHNHHRNRIENVDAEKSKVALVFQLPRLHENVEIAGKITSSIASLSRHMKNNMQQMMPGIGFVVTMFLQMALAHARAAASVAGLISNMALGSAVMTLMRQSLFPSMTEPKIKHVYVNEPASNPAMNWAQD